jgi:hypothetical protein
MKHCFFWLRFCAGGILLNWLPSHAAALAGLPVFFDTWGTIAAAFCGGLVPALAVGALYNILESLVMAPGDLPDFLFALCNMFTALVVWLWTRLFPRELDMRPDSEAAVHKNTAETIFALTTLALTLCVVMSVSGGLIAFFIRTNFPLSPGGSAADNLFKLGLVRQGLPSWAVEIIARIPVNVADRFISVAAAFGRAQCYLRLANKIRPQGRI